VYPSILACGCSVTDEDDHEDECSCCSDGWPGHVPAEEPGLRGRLGQGFINWRKRKRDDLPAIGADGEVGEGLLALVRGQGALDEGAELVRVWMMPGLEEFAHS
jgi:hypothetical protein